MAGSRVVVASGELDGVLKGIAAEESIAMVGVTEFVGVRGVIGAGAGFGEVPLITVVATGGSIDGIGGIDEVVDVLGVVDGIAGGTSVGCKIGSVSVEGISASPGVEACCVISCSVIAGEGISV